MNHTVDIGNNLTSLLERLAQQIGTTADKVFPWYVQQAHNEGVTALIAFAVIFVLVLTVFAIAFIVDVRSESEPALGVTLCSGIVLIMTLGIGGIEAVDATRKIMNPNYYAMTMLTRDVGRLVAK